MWFWLITIVSNVDNKFSDGVNDYSITIWPPILVSSNYFKFAKWHKVFFQYSFFSSAERVWAKHFQIESHKKLTKVPKNLSHILFFWFQQILIWIFFSPGFFYQVCTFKYSLNEFNSIGWKILHCWINIKSRFWFDFFSWWNSSKYVSINL